MKKLILFFTLAAIFTCSLSFGQIYNPVKWEYKSVKTSDDTYDVIFIAKIESGWFIYSQNIKDDGPIPTAFNFDMDPWFKLKGDTEECELNRKKTFDKLFDMELVKYGKKAIFVQSVKSAEPGVMTGYLEFMTCDATKCLPPAQIDFEIDLTKSMAADAINYSSSSLCEGNVKFVATNIIAPVYEDPISNPQTTVKKKIKSASKKDLRKVKQAVKAQKKVDKEESQFAISMPDGDSELEDPVKWNLSVGRMENGDALLEFNADIEKGWYIYSNTLESDDGPVKTNITFEESDAYTPNEGIVEEAADIVSDFDSNFDMVLTKLKKSASFNRTVKIHDESELIKGYFEYMACTNRMCLTPAYVDFEADIKNQTIKFGDQLVDMAEIAGDGDVDELEKMYGLSYAALQDPIGACVEKIEQSNSLWGIFILGFLGGLLALLTPCVFPMIPLTVSFFTKSSEKKGGGLFNAIFYGFSILMVYVLISVPFHLLDSVNPNILNDISTNMWLNIAFFLIFLFFAFSFFGYFELTLPASVTNKTSAAEGVGGILGIFFMALTLALVSFSCTGPILGSLLAGSLSSDGGAWELTSGFAGFGLALGLPFGLFAAFPSMMNSLPKSGGWLNTVKVVLGFIELALAFKFLSNADLVKQWGVLKIEPFLVIWIIIFAAMALYLFGKIKFPHDSPLNKIPVPRLSLGILSLAFAVYLASGFRTSERTGSYQPLSLLSGLAPPVCYSFVYKCKCPQGLECYKDLSEGLAYARSVNKPVLLDFTGHACVNCRKMEEHVWPEPEVYKYLRDDYVLISLYVDEKIALPEEEQVTLPKRAGGTQKMRFTGNRWAYLQSEYFNINAQPYYVLMTPDGQLLNNPVPYTPDKNEYAEFLECGLRSYEQLGLK